MTDVDLTTGLPAVGENQFWRVRNHVPGWEELGNSPYIVVELIERTEIDFQEPRIFFGMQFGYKAWVRKISEVVVAKQIAWSDLTAPEKSQREIWYVRHDGELYFRATADDLKPEWILRAAVKALAEYKDKQKAQGLLGDYPPKSLNDPKETGEN